MTRELTGKAFLFYLCAFFLVVFAVNGYFAYAAVVTFSGADESQAYREGMQYNAALARRAVQAKLGWTATIGANRLASGKIVVAVSLKRPDGAPVSNLQLYGKLEHPSDEARDKILHFAEVRAGEYVGEANGVSPGAWDAIVETPEHAVPFEATRRLWVR